MNILERRVCIEIVTTPWSMGHHKPERNFSRGWNEVWCVREALCLHSVSTFIPFNILSQLFLSSKVATLFLPFFIFSLYCKLLRPLPQAFQSSSFLLAITISPPVLLPHFYFPFTLQPSLWRVTLSISSWSFRIWPHNCFF